jgi:hypothetical protein
MDELTLFGKAMAYRDDDTGGSWVTQNKEIPVVVYSWLKGGSFSWTCFLPGHPPLSPDRRFVSKEQARDDAERALRELYEALGEMVEPWTYDATPPVHGYYLAACLNEVSGLSETSELYWNGAAWYPDCGVDWPVTFQPYAWRPMPKAPPRKP